MFEKGRRRDFFVYDETMYHAHIYFTLDEIAAHTLDARWLGEKLPLNLEILKQLMR